MTNVERPERPGESSLTNGIHVLTAVLLIVTVSASVQLDLQFAVINVVICALFAFLYFFGSELWEGWPPIAQFSWLLGLSGLWVLMLPLADVGVYLLLSLFFLYMRVLDDYRGIVAVVVATVVAIAAQIPKGITVGAVMGPAVSALVVVAIYYAFRTLWQVSTERQELIEQLMATRTQLAASEHAAGMAAERQRIAHEIHDTVAQGLSSIQMLLHAAERDLGETGLSEHDAAPVRTRIDQARRTASENLAEARAMIAALQPAGLSSTSLEGALRRVATSFGASVEMDIEVDVEGEVYDLPMKTEAVLLRISQGAVGNVVKHSQASRARITVSYEEGEVRLDVVDNGRGFDPQAVAQRPAGLGHVGLDAMRRRAAEVGGTLTVESEPGAGTAMSVAIPVKNGVLE
ncbi:sensor histidine kinase [Corynebacterium lowii]|uniref:Oxygen sensor histidine kinase NreB n=1 Tax=Corynebacterium lowii TaxID=1544413 RepID=A0A0Q0YBN9_9CORY|nr:sensor histidine kinase [Corynebacterium lowii]KQB83427.1 Sensor histidine kinase LiaS [Corynebacterium lowii]MDP9852470.1 signal transduction histidine kinase [Corynebacterium lowii]